jgi:hypothetical protein
MSNMGRAGLETARQLSFVQPFVHTEQLELSLLRVVFSAHDTARPTELGSRQWKGVREVSMRQRGT